MIGDRIAEIKETANSFIDRVQRIVVFAVGLAGVVFIASIVAFIVRIICSSIPLGFITFVATVVIGTIWLLKYTGKKYGPVISDKNTNQS